MNRILHSAAIAALLGTVALAGCKKDAPDTPAPEASPPATAPSAGAPMAGGSTAPAAPVVVTTVDLGNAVGAGKHVEVPMTVFGRNDTIHASVGTRVTDGAAPTRSKLTARWTYQDGQVVDELSQDYSFTGSDNTMFQISNPDGWPTGTYKLEILLDDNVVQTRQFEVR